MGNRYGRNQRRRAREQIALLQAESSKWHGAYRLEADSRCAMESQMADLAVALGVHYVGFPVREIVMKANDLAHDSFRLMAPSGAAEAMKVMRVDSHHDERSQMHVRVRLGPSIVAYAISERALLRTPSTYLARTIADELARALLAEFRKSAHTHG